MSINFVSELLAGDNEKEIDSVVKDGNDSKKQRKVNFCKDPNNIESKENENDQYYNDRYLVLRESTLKGKIEFHRYRNKIKGTI